MPEVFVGDRGIIQPQWEKGPIEQELDELPGHAARLGFEIPDFVRAYESASLEDLSDEDWFSMRNCDTREGQTWTVEAMKEYRGYERDINDIEKRMRGHDSVYAPSVLFREGHEPFLIGGNTRLMMCTALKIRPKVVAVRM